MKETPLLDSIHSIDDFKRIKEQQLPQLAEEIRSFLVERVSHTGGHLASNLGVVELTIALHRVFNSPVDKILFDVGHQAYVHKILTGRAAEFDGLRQKTASAGSQNVRKARMMHLAPATPALLFPLRLGFYAQSGC